MRKEQLLGSEQLRRRVAITFMRSLCGFLGSSWLTTVGKRMLSGWSLAALTYLCKEGMRHLLLLYLGGHREELK